MIFYQKIIIFSSDKTILVSELPSFSVLLTNSKRICYNTIKGFFKWNHEI